MVSGIPDAAHSPNGRAWCLIIHWSALFRSMSGNYQCEIWIILRNSFTCDGGTDEKMPCHYNGSCWHNQANIKFGSRHSCWSRKHSKPNLSKLYLKGLSTSQICLRQVVLVPICTGDNALCNLTLLPQCSVTLLFVKYEKGLTAGNNQSSKPFGLLSINIVGESKIDSSEFSTPIYASWTWNTPDSYWLQYLAMLRRGLEEPNS